MGQGGTKDVIDVQKQTDVQLSLTSESESHFPSNFKGNLLLNERIRLIVTVFLPDGPNLA